MQFFANIKNFIFPGRADQAGSSVPDGRMAFWILMVALVYQAVLCAIHTNVHAISVAGVGLTEAAIYLACISVLIKRIRLEFLAVATVVVAYLLLMAILRNQLDPKGFRDVMIPILFYGLGREIGDVKYTDRLLKLMVLVVLAFGFFELFFLDWFSRVFNIFSYYVNQGGLAAGSNWAKDSVLGLNGIRPEGIGRTILPSLIGNHRISSIFLEPVSLGNFAVIIAAWGLSKRRDEIKEMVFFVLAAAIMIALSDSRYGMITVAALVVLRCLPLGRTNAWAMVLPLLSVALLLLLATVFGGHYSDSVLGRLFVSGKTLSNLDLGMIFGLDGFNTSYGDMGYPSLLTRLGLLLCIFLWGAFWMLKMADERGDRFRAYITLYMSLILCVSGTSLFALKTAGVLWFLVGCYAGRPKDVPAPSPVTASQPSAT
ncbi:polysaccharide polymerase [Collimonas sp.]|jgi:putative polymerase|uniref:polysaccharide polymerase n=1 Tax=Collimonas sp. TaxID=1963772 RepID=UPI002CED888B|nr:polysaccharide polymerase [Collimonas sp.]HWW04330.1 polysaccharide polymerase [Collimonas sp.]